MANVEKTVEILLKKFDNKTEYEKRKIVFWYDNEKTVWSEIEQIPTEDFDAIVKELDSQNGIKFQILNNNYFATKKLLEMDDPDSDYLIYSPLPEPKPRDNWLLDIQLYSGRYESSRLADIKIELGVDRYDRDEFFKSNQSFFASKQRLMKFKKCYEPDSTEEEQWYRCLLSSIVGSLTNDIKEIIRVILMESIDEEDNDYWKSMVKFDLVEKFWDLIKTDFGFTDSTPTLEKLFLSFIITHIFQISNVNLKGYTQYNNCVSSESEIFLQNWLNHTHDSKMYDDLSIQLLGQNNAQIEKEFTAQFNKSELNEYINVESVDIVDKNIIRKIVDELINGNEDFDVYLEWIEKRKTKHWYPNFRNLYCAVKAAVELYRFAKKFNEEDLSPLGLQELFNNYTDNYYLMDYHYRKFYYYYEQDIEKEVLKKNLRGGIENLYSNILLNKLLDKWSDAIDSRMGDTWKIELVEPQVNFFNVHVKPIVVKNDRDKVAVIVSDALRYEVAVELQEVLNRDTKGLVNKSAMLGNIPSYTQLGMASLLPHKELTYKNKTIYVDGMSTQGLENRNKILVSKVKDSIALQASKILDMNAHEARNLIKGKRVVYIYHNEIDAMGDDRAKEHGVFGAANLAIIKIKKLVDKLCKSMNVNNVIITSDHGFLYNHDRLENVDKIDISSTEKSYCIDISKRYSISKQQFKMANTHCFDISSIFNADTNLFAYFPRTFLRFKKKGGGVNFVHGGISLQEVVIPVLTYNHQRQEINLKKKGIKYGKVNITILNPERRIMSSPFLVHLFQTEKVTEKVQPIKCKVALWDMDKDQDIISDQKLIIAESTADNPVERQQKVRLTLSSKIENKVYYLRIIDEDPKAIKKDIIEPIPFEVDLIITDDF